MEGDKPMLSMLTAAQEIHFANVTAFNEDDVAGGRDADAFHIADFRLAPAFAKPHAVALVNTRLAKNERSGVILIIYVPNTRAFIQAEQKSTHGQIND